MVAVNHLLVGNFQFSFCFPINLSSCLHAIGVNILVSCTFIYLCTTVHLRILHIFHSIALNFVLVTNS
uniref:Uncharacterized protein n=1 Tax=Arundo donax TaxID=35708 RepID=A0A0A9FFH3_ARUDO